MQKTDWVLGLIGLVGFGVAGFLVYRNNQAIVQADTPHIVSSDALMENNFIENFVSDSMSEIGLGEKRGIRNNNPGNLVITSIPWKGKVPVAKNTDGKFEQFTKSVDGIRAMFIDLRGDIEKDGLNTIRKLINEYAPKFENNTAAYVQSVASQVGIGADTRVLPANYFSLVKAIIKHENGKQPYPDSVIMSGINAA
jgi:hypothetical protein